MVIRFKLVKFLTKKGSVPQSISANPLNYVDFSKIIFYIFVEFG